MQPQVKSTFQSTDRLSNDLIAVAAPAIAALPAFQSTDRLSNDLILHAKPEVCSPISSNQLIA